MTAPFPSRDLARTTLAVLFIGVLIAANVWILKPFLPSLVWAAIIVVATWPLLIRAQSLLGGKRAAAVTVMTLGLLALLIAPIILAVVTLLDNVERVREVVKTLEAQGLPPLPAWVSGIPLAGPKMAEAWNELASAGQDGLAARLAPHVKEIVSWFVDQAGGFGLMIVQLLLTVIIAAILYSGGETTADAVRRFARRLAGQKGDDVTILAGKAIRGVALGVGLTALVQSVLGGIGLALTGVPGATVLTAVMLLLCIAQLGPGLVLVPAVIWLFWSGQTLWGTILLVWTVVVGTMDNFLRPILIRKGADLPLLLIFVGVIGGLIAFGIIGLFIGPVVLAVTYTLLAAWVSESPSEPLRKPSE
ncbi:MAG: putative inner membrane protein [Syntrophaceae bacterium PtaB.Bin038]|nr:MAG: putative inner membrane protein [Syntrophaceae bacterium PtaB.Bin038]